MEWLIGEARCNRCNHRTTMYYVVANADLLKCRPCGAYPMQLLGVQLPALLFHRVWEQVHLADLEDARWCALVRKES
jgi:hypothetical protein